MRFLKLGYAAEMHPRRAAGIGGRRAAALEIGGQQVQVHLEFLVEIAIEVAGVEEGSDAFEKSHESYPFVICSRRPMVPATRCQSRASWASCLRPARVME